MKTLEEHNREFSQAFHLPEPKPTGVACDKCGCEMTYDNPNILLASIPPKYSVFCESCGYRSYMMSKMTV